MGNKSHLYLSFAYNTLKKKIAYNGQEKMTRYNKFIISYLNFAFEVPKGYDKVK